MRKPLELTIHPAAVCICELSGPEATGYDWNCDVPDHGWMQFLMEDKRIAEHELAAEWARSAFVTGIHGPHADGSRTEVLHRFAALPHYDEEPAG